MGDNLEDSPNWNAVLQWSLRFQDSPNPNRELTEMDEEVCKIVLRCSEQVLFHIIYNTLIY